MRERKTNEPVIIDVSILEVAFRALTNASIAVNQFTERQNYGPAIQQLIIDFKDLHDLVDGINPFNMPNISKACRLLCTDLEDHHFDYAEILHCDLHLWEKGVTPEERMAFYRKLYNWDKDLNPETENETVKEPEA